MAVADGGSMLSVVASGISDGSSAWCKVGTVMVAADSVSGGVVQCVSCHIHHRSSRLRVESLAESVSLF